MKADLYNAQARTAGTGAIAHRTAAGFVVLTSADGTDLIDLINTKQSESDLIDQIVAHAQSDGPEAFAMLFTAGGDLYLIASGTATASITSPSTQLSMSPAPGQVLVHPLSAGINETSANIRLRTSDEETAAVTNVALKAGTIEAEWVEVAVGEATIDLGAPSSPSPSAAAAGATSADSEDSEDEAQSADEDDQTGESAEEPAEEPAAPAETEADADLAIDEPAEEPAAPAETEADADLAIDEPAEEPADSDDDDDEPGDEAIADVGAADEDDEDPAADAGLNAESTDDDSSVVPTAAAVAVGGAVLSAVVGNDLAPSGDDVALVDDASTGPTPIVEAPAEAPAPEPPAPVAAPEPPAPAPEPPAPAAALEPPAPAPEPPAPVAAPEPPAPAPEPPAPAAAAPEPPAPAPAAAAASPAVGGPVMVLGVACSQGHHNHPDAVYCSQCGTKMGVHHTTVLLNGPRPPLGVLVVDDGTTYSLNEDLVVGREPTSHEDVIAGTASPMILTDETLSLSRKHARIVLDEWQVAIQDLGSSNGTYLSRSGESNAWTRVESGSTTPLEPGDRLRVGGRIIQVELHHVR